MATSLKELFDLIIWAVIGIIAVAGIIWAAWALWEGFNGDQPESKKRGIVIGISTIVIVVFLIAAKVIVWDMIATKLGPAGSITISVFLKGLWL